MPEGDSIRRAAALLGPLLTGARVTGAASRWPAVVDGVVGGVITALEPVGKHLLLHLDDATTLRVHLGMNGRWRVLPPGAGGRWSLGRTALRLDTAAGTALCLDAPTVERFRTRERAEQPALQLGPDVLAEGFDPDGAAARAVTHPGTAAEALLDQRVVCGVGNVWKCELLFVHRLDPFAAAAAVPVATWAALWRDAHTRMTAQVARGGLRDTTGLGPGAPRHWVYERRGRPCLRCGARISSRTHGRDLPRTTWWCPRCQAPRPPAT
jgi:endonuclease-8